MDTISRSFKAKKEKILSDLSLPDEEYTDLSPKGSVDVGIRHLIRDINNLPGLVTTSSCAGRISVFLEGGKPAKSSSDANDGKPITSSSSEGQEEPEGPEDIKIGSGNTSDQRTQFAATGGKGSGRWQYVSHDPVLIDDSPRAEHRYHELFGLGISEGEVSLDSATGLRLARFHFEPMILHIMAASLKHAQPVLAAATSAGFRESGIQSLRCLDDSDVCPIVAVRTSGLALESVIGYLEENKSQDGCISVRSLVSEDYLSLLFKISNERFQTNSDRMERFYSKLMELTGMQTSDRSSRRGQREDPNVRRERKRTEGLRKKRDLREAIMAKQQQRLVDSELEEHIPIEPAGLGM